MKELGIKLKDAREELGKSIRDVADITKIRTHIISNMENGDFDKLPKVYGKSFLKTYISYLKLDEQDFTEAYTILSGPKPTSIVTESEDQKGKMSITFSDLTNYKDIFKSGKLSGVNKNNMINIIIYSVVFIGFILIMYITFFSESNESKIVDGIEPMPGGVPDTAIIESEDKGLFSFFDKPDSLILEGTATDTSWIKIDIDGKAVSEVLMLPLMKRKWAAKEYFIINQGNVGAIQLSLNGKLLEPFGNKGSVISNIKVTANEVIKTSPWKTKPKQEDAPKIIEPSKIDPSTNQINDTNPQ